VAVTRCIAAIIMASVLTVACARSDESSTREEPWYHASDVALLATTGRPQLVEFFHPD